jgi:hypothetical protein
MTTLVPPMRAMVTICELQPVTWNSGTEISVFSGSAASRGSSRQRSTLSAVVRKFSCVVIAPLGRPVVPLV